MKRLPALILILLISLCASACATDDADQASTPATSDGDDSTSPTSTPVPPPPTPTPATSTPASPTSTAAPEPEPAVEFAEPEAIPVDDIEGPILELFQDIAYPDDRRPVGFAIDYGRFFATVGTSPEALCDSASEFVTAYDEAGSGVPLLGPLDLLGDAQSAVEGARDVERSFGFRYCDINAFVNIGESNRFYHVETDPELVIAAAESDDRWSDVLEVERRDDLTMLGWSAELPESLGREKSAMFADYLGGGALALRGHTVARGESVEVVDAALDPSAASFTERGTVGAAVALALEEGAFAVFFSARPHTLWPAVAEAAPGQVELVELTPGATANAEDGLPLWTTVAMGATMVDGEPQAVLVMAHVSDEDAVESASRFEAMVTSGASTVDGTPYRDRITLVDIRTEGQFVIAHTGTPASPELALSQLQRPLFQVDSLYAVGQVPN